MPDINLTEQEAQTLLRCLNDRLEPPEELAVWSVYKRAVTGFDVETKHIGVALFVHPKG